MKWHKDTEIESESDDDHEDKRERDKLINRCVYI